MNGLNPDLFLKWVNLLNLAGDGAANRHINALSTLLRKKWKNYRLCAYNVSNNLYEYLDESVRIYILKSNQH